MQFAIAGDPLHLPFSKKRIRASIADRQYIAFGNDDPDRLGQPTCFFEPCLVIARLALCSDRRANDEGPRTAGNFSLDFVIIEYQALSLSSSSSKSVVRSTGDAG